MANFCVSCGKPIRPGSGFCEYCGAAVAPSAHQAPDQAPPTASPATYTPQPTVPWGEVRQGIPPLGFSDRVNHPEILSTVKKSRNAAKIFAVLLVPLPLAGFIIYSLVTGEMEFGQAALYGGVVSCVFLLFALFSFLKERAKNTYEGEVIDQRSRRTQRHANSDNAQMVTEFITVVRTSDGKRKKIVEWEGSQIWAYNYLHVGDRFKYHPQFHFPYELYDKSRAPFLKCVSCGRENPVVNDRCEKCHIPLLK